VDVDGIVDVAELKKRWVGFEFDLDDFEVSEQEMLDYALAVGEREPRFVDPGHPDFQAVPSFPAKFVSRHRVLPEGFPPMGRRSFDAGKCVTALGPIRADMVLSGKSLIADIYEKTGRSGPMRFVVHRMEFANPAGEMVAVVDWRLVQQVGEE